MCAINKSASVYVNSSNYNDQVCASTSSEEQLSSTQEELVCKAPNDTAKVNSLPKGKVDKPLLSFFPDEKNASISPKAGISSINSNSPENLVCSEENYFNEPEIQNASPAEADINVSLINNKVKASGSITIRNEFIRKSFEEVLKSTDKVENAKITFDSNTNSFKVTGKYNPDYLPKQNFTLILKPTIENQKLGLKLDSNDYWGIFKDSTGEGIVEKINSKGLNASYNSKTKVISIDTDSILQKTKEVHYSTKADLSKNELSIGSNSVGDLFLYLNDPGVEQPENKTNKSDVTIKIDKPSLKATLQKAFGDNLSIVDVDLKDGEATVKGLAKANGIKTGIIGIIGLWGIGTNDITALSKANDLNGSPAPQINTEIKVSLQGREVVMKPTSSSHLEELAEAMKKEGYKLSKIDEKKNEIRFPINELLPSGSSGNINNAKITGEGLSLDGTF